MLQLHVAIIMDGNGRWAIRRGLRRSAGHRAGVQAVRRVVEAAPDCGVTMLTLFAFSSDNWMRPRDEVKALMWMLRGYLRSETQRFIDSGARLLVIGRRDRLAAQLRAEIHRVERATADGRRLTVRIAIDYSSRDSILRAATTLPTGRVSSREDFARLLASPNAITDTAPVVSQVDLLIRTGGEQRLSDFMLWESAYAELLFSDLMWPEFAADDLRAAVEEFHRRERRFGALRNPKPGAASGQGET
ncbi:MAG: di-trans,poly-cis-decaprenylcistransferase [Candidatus Binatus sp.]